MKIISNSSPLINFTTLGRLALLHQLYETIVIPDAVYQEVIVAGKGRPRRNETEHAEWIVRESVANQTAVAALHTLDRGEAEAIVLTVENPGSLLLMDERQGRLVAIHLGVNVIGTLGVLLIAKRKGLLAALAPEIEALQTRVGFRISADLKTRVLQEAGELE